jgi:Bacterial SH3 domain
VYWIATFFVSTKSGEDQNLMLIPLGILVLGGVIWGVVLISRSHFIPSPTTKFPTGDPIALESNNVATRITPLSVTTTPSRSPTYAISVPSITPTSHFSTTTRATTPTNTPAPTQTPTLTSTESPWDACPGSYLSRLHIGDRAYVSFDPPLPNRVRSDPGKDGKIIGRIQPGEEVKIFDGPACENGWVWWYVRSKETGLIGWTAEGDYENYWLVPLPVMPQNKMLLWKERCLKKKSYRASFHNLATLASIRFLRVTGLS